MRASSSCRAVIQFSWFQTRKIRNKVTLRVVGRGGLVSEVKTNWYPTLFRGCMYYGDVDTFSVVSILNRVAQKTANLSGLAVVEAVGLEKTSTGPRLFCHEWVKNMASEYESFFVQVTDFKKACPGSDSGEVARPDHVYELLWPAFQFNSENDCGIEVHEILDLLLPAINLWQAYQNRPFGKQYYEFLRLVIRSSLVFFGKTRCAEEARRMIADRLAPVMPSEKAAAMMNFSRA